VSLGSSNVSAYTSVDIFALKMATSVPAEMLTTVSTQEMRLNPERRSYTLDGGRENPNDSVYCSLSEPQAAHVITALQQNNGQ
jgi:hypothetical protein